jgi:hypothetical protein
LTIVKRASKIVDKKTKKNKTMKLLKYLTELSTTNNNWSLFVDPNNINEYKITQTEYGIEGYINVGTLDKLSFGNQNVLDAIKYYLNDNKKNGIIYNEKRVKYNPDAILQACFDDNLDADFSDFLNNEAEDIMDIWAKNEAEFWITNTLPDILNNRE